MKWSRYYALVLLALLLLSVFVRADDGGNNQNQNAGDDDDQKGGNKDNDNDGDDDSGNVNGVDNDKSTSPAPTPTPVPIPNVNKDSHGNTCHKRAAVVSGECVCTTGYSGDGKKNCGCKHPARFVMSPTATTTGAIIQLIVPAGAYNISIIGVDATYYATANAGNWAIFQTDGTTKGAAMSGAYPWPVMNAAGYIYFQLTAPVTSSTYMIRYTYWLNGVNKMVSIFTDGVLVTPDTGACGQLDDLHLMQFGYTTAPRLGDMALSWLPSTYQVEFDVTAWYEKDMAIVLVDTVEFNAFNDTVRARPTGSCSAHAAMDASIPFPDLFQAAPTATSPLALNDGYLAYPDSSSTGWTTSAINCSHVMYSRAFALSELGNCNNVIHSTGTDPLTGAAMLIYSGMIYIHTLQPAEDHALIESLGYAKFTQKFPWAAYIYTESEALVQVSSDTTRIHVVVRNFELQGSNMFLQLETLTQAQGIELPAVRIVSASGQTALITPDPVLSLQAGSAPCINNAETDMCTQQWIYRKPSWIDTDNRMYYFQWAVYGTAGADILTVPISLQLRVNDVKVVYGRLGDLSLSIYSDLPNASAKSANTKGVTYPWHVNERIFLRGDVAMNPTDVPAFTMSYTQLYICYSTVAGHDISLASGGCLDPTVSDASRVQLIANGAVQNSLSTNAFQTALVPMANTTSTITSGVAFNAWPLTSEAHVYTIHAKVLVKSRNGKKREFEMLVRRDADPNSPSSATQLMILPDTQQTTPTSSFSITFDSTTVTIGALSVAGVFTVVGLVIVATIIVRRRSRAVNHV